MPNQSNHSRDGRRETAGVEIRQMGVVRAEEVIYVGIDDDIIIYIIKIMMIVTLVSHSL